MAQALQRVGRGDSCLDSGELAQLEMVKGSPPTVKSGLLEGERRAAGIRFEPTPTIKSGPDKAGSQLGVKGMIRIVSEVDPDTPLKPSLLHSHRKAVTCPLRLIGVSDLADRTSSAALYSNK